MLCALDEIRARARDYCATMHPSEPFWDISWLPNVLETIELLRYRRFVPVEDYVRFCLASRKAFNVGRKTLKAIDVWAEVYDPAEVFTMVREDPTSVASLLSANSTYFAAPVVGDTVSTIPWGPPPEWLPEPEQQVKRLATPTQIHLDVKPRPKKRTKTSFRS